MITSVHNPRVKQARRLREARARREHGLFLIDGEREIGLALAAGVEIESIFATPVEPSRSGDPHSQPFQDMGPRILQLVSDEVLTRLSYGERGAAPVAVARQPALGLERLKWSADSLVLVLDRTEKPGNLGACLRSAAACGVDAVVLTQPVCELFNPNTIRASRGTVFTLPIAISTPGEFLSACASLGLSSIYAARVDAQTSLWDCRFAAGTALVFGSEAQGLGDEWQVDSVCPYTIPMTNRADSLNLSISAAVTLYEAVRQRLATDQA